MPILYFINFNHFCYFLKIKTSLNFFFPTFLFRVCFSFSARSNTPLFLNPPALMICLNLTLKMIFSNLIKWNFRNVFFFEFRKISPLFLGFIIYILTGVNMGRKSLILFKFHLTFLFMWCILVLISYV